MAVMKKSIPSQVFDLFNYLLLTLLGLTCLLPILHIAAISLSDSAATTANLVTFWPVNFTTASYEEVFTGSGFIKAFGVSTMRIIVGTAVNLLLIVITAYPLSREASEMKGRNGIIWYYVFTMMFSGGLIPYFLVVNKVGLMDSFWSMIIPAAVPVFSVIMMMNFFRGIPGQLYEAALIDGAGHFTVLFRIFLPLSKASIATLALFAMVGHWNDWFTGLIFLNDKNKYPLQTYLRQMLIQIDFSALTQDDIERIRKLSDRSFRAAQLFMATVPILCVYPFLQKYFVTGVTLGAVKE